MTTRKTGLKLTFTGALPIDAGSLEDVARGAGAIEDIRERALALGFVNVVVKTRVDMIDVPDPDET